MEPERECLTGSYYPWYALQAAVRESAGGEAIEAGRAAATGRARPPQPWPRLLWFLLKFLGLFNRRPAVARRRLCFGCSLAAAERRSAVTGEFLPWFLYPGCQEDPGGDGDGNGDDLRVESGEVVGESERGPGGGPMATFASADDPCVVCQCEWWDANGNYSPYTENDIGLKGWNHYGSELLSVVWMAAVVVLNLVQFWPYLTRYWGQTDSTVDFIIYGSFILSVIFVPALCLTAGLLNMVNGARRACTFGWHRALSLTYIVKRLQHLELGEKGLPYKGFLVVCAFWTTGNSAWRVRAYVAGFQVRMPPLCEVSLFATALGLAVWGAFCYLVALMRLSLQRQLGLEVAFVRRHCGQLGRCRRRLAVSLGEVACLAGLASAWLTYTLAACTWGVATQVYFDYAVRGGNHSFATNMRLDPIIWSELAMFLVLPLLAVGGLDLSRTWHLFRRRLSLLRLMDLGGGGGGDDSAGGGGERSLDRFCDALLAFCAEHPPVRSVQTMAVLVSALGLCLAIEFREGEPMESVIHHAHLHH